MYICMCHLDVEDQEDIQLTSDIKRSGNIHGHERKRNFSEEAGIDIKSHLEIAHSTETETNTGLVLYVTMV